MTIGILGKKLGMTQLFQEDGTVVPVTVVQAGPCKVMQVKAKEVSELPESDRNAANNRGKQNGKSERPRRDDGYYSVQLGFDPKNDKASRKAEVGHAARSGSPAMWYVREFRYDALPPYQQGDEIKVDVLKDVSYIDVTGTSKGLGHTGTIRRHNFARQSTTHGNSKSHRRQGGIGRQYSTAKGVTKGKKMPGHKGTDRITVQNVEVVKIDAERNLLYVKGAIPGKPAGYVMVREAVKK
ncbi:MAG: 50S ribosomal protein L3 [Planctomycetota bacterium]|nr:50S ribosomal protein L3 [Planctomycetota bacterium]